MITIKILSDNLIEITSENGNLTICLTEKLIDTKAIEEIAKTTDEFCKEEETELEKYAGQINNEEGLKTGDGLNEFVIGSF